MQAHSLDNLVAPARIAMKLYEYCANGFTAKAFRRQSNLSPKAQEFKGKGPKTFAEMGIAQHTEDKECVSQAYVDVRMHRS